MTLPEWLASEPIDYRRLDSAAYLKGLLKPFKGKGELELWASQCETLRDRLTWLAQQQILTPLRHPPFSLLPVYLARHPGGTGTVLLRWRTVDHQAMGVALWQQLIQDPCTPAHLHPTLLWLEEQRITLNMQISLLHTLARQARHCAGQMQEALAHYESLGRG